MRSKHLNGRGEKAGGTLVACDTNPIDAVWNDQPAAADGQGDAARLRRLPARDAEAKRTRIAEEIKASMARDAAVITMPDSICWLLNIRGGDVPHTPFALSFAILHGDGSTDLFMDERKSLAGTGAASGQCRAAARRRRRIRCRRSTR